MQCLMRLHLPHIVSLEQPLKLLRRDGHDILLMVSRPGESLSTFQNFVPKHKSRARPPDALDPVTPTRGEAEERSFAEWVPLHHLLHDRAQTVATPAHIHRRAMQEYLLDPLRSEHHSPPARSPAATMRAATLRTR